MLGNCACHLQKALQQCCLCIQESDLEEALRRKSLFCLTAHLLHSNLWMHLKQGSKAWSVSLNRLNLQNGICPVTSCESIPKLFRTLKLLLKQKINENIKGSYLYHLRDKVNMRELVKY